MMVCIQNNQSSEGGNPYQENSQTLPGDLTLASVASIQSPFFIPSPDSKAQSNTDVLGWMMQNKDKRSLTDILNEAVTISNDLPPTGISFDQSTNDDSGDKLLPKQ